MPVSTFCIYHLTLLVMRFKYPALFFFSPLVDKRSVSPSSSSALSLTFCHADTVFFLSHLLDFPFLLSSSPPLFLGLSVETWCIQSAISFQAAVSRRIYKSRENLSNALFGSSCVLLDLYPKVTQVSLMMVCCVEKKTPKKLLIYVSKDATMGARQKAEKHIESSPCLRVMAW